MGRPKGVKNKPKEEKKPEGEEYPGIPRVPKILAPELLRAYRTISNAETIPDDADSLLKMIWKLKEDDPKGFLERLYRQEVEFKKAWNDEKQRLDGLREKRRQEGRAAEARNLEAESAARRGAPPAELADAAGPTLALIDRVLGEYAT